MNPSNQQEYEAKLARRIKFRPLIWLIKKPIVNILLHWIFQGILFMDVTERNLRIISELVVAALLFGILSTILHQTSALIIALLLAHTLNFIFNSQIWANLRHFGYVKHSFEEFEQYIAEISIRVNQEPSINYAAVYGSIVRDRWKSTSDLDVRLLKKSGWKNGVRVYLFVLKERTRAVGLRFPIDINMLDRIESLRDIRADEIPIILKCQ